MIKINDPVIAVLQSPREKIWGVLREINPAGIFVRGVELSSFENLVRAAAADNTFYGLSEQFIPMWRVEKVSKDEPDGDIPATFEEFENRTGESFSNFFAE